MTPDDAIDAIRFLDHQAKFCRDRDTHEAFTLLLPAMLRVLGLDRMDDVEAAAFRHGFKRDLEALPDRLARPQELQGAPGRAFGVRTAGVSGTKYAASPP